MVVTAGSGVDVSAGGEIVVVIGGVGVAGRQAVRNRRRATRRMEHGFNWFLRNRQFLSVPTRKISDIRVPSFRPSYDLLSSARYSRNYL